MPLPCSLHIRKILIIIDDLNGVFATVATEVLGMMLSRILDLFEFT